MIASDKWLSLAAAATTDMYRLHQITQLAAHDETPTPDDNTICFTDTFSVLLSLIPTPLMLHSPNATCCPIFRRSRIASTPVLANCNLISAWIAAAQHTTLPS
jgi:hypothetical protein